MRSLHKRKSDTRKIIEDVEYFVKFKRSLNLFVSKMYSFYYYGLYGCPAGISGTKNSLGDQITIV